MISIFYLFSVGIGPSSSHTIGPMRAACAFVKILKTKKLLPSVNQVRIELFGSLAATGKGHGTDMAILMGLSGYLPETFPDSSRIRKKTAYIRHQRKIKLAGERFIPFYINRDFVYRPTIFLPKHSNALRLRAYHKNRCLLEKTYYSIGGGFIVDATPDKKISLHLSLVSFPFFNAKTLLKLCRQHHLTIAELIFKNEKNWRTEKEIKEKLLTIAEYMQTSLDHGLKHKGILPGILKVKRRAATLAQKLKAKKITLRSQDPRALNWVSAYALAVAEENANGGRIVTAPTNGAAGIIPAVLAYYKNYYRIKNPKKIMEFLLTAGGIALLYKMQASISGAEVGCQGEVGVACSMAAGALTAVLGGTLSQIENAAEMAMEHHLGLICDPVAGLVQIPCIERNAIAASMAIRIAHLAMMESGRHKISLDRVIHTMKNVGEDIPTKYKETAKGGLAVTK